MKNKVFLILLLICVVFAFSSCKKTYTSIKQVQALEEGVDSPSTIKELEEAIEKYEDRVNDILIAEQQVGMWYKILATRYLEQEMYAKALDTLQQAILYYPTNQSLYYYVGVCAGYMAKSSLDIKATGDTSKRQNYLNLAESAYLRTLELDPKYTKALYGLSVLYVFELDQSEKAIPYLEKLLTIDTRDSQVMFVLARAYYLNYEFQAAVDMYDRIISTTNADSVKADAEANKKIVLDVMYAN